MPRPTTEPLVEKVDHRAMIPTKVPGIYRRGTGYTIVFRDPEGRQRKRAARTMGEAKALRASLVADVQRGEFRELSRMPFADYARSWAATYAGRTGGGVRESTMREYRRQVEQRIIPYFGRRTVSSIDPRSVKAFVQSVADEGVSRDTARLALAPLRAMLQDATEEGLIRSNPAAGIRLPRPAVVDEDAGEEQAKALTEPELRALLAHVAPARVLVVRTLAESGLRVGEALALRWQDVDFGRCRVQVRRTVYEGRFGPPKSRYGRRDVPIGRDLAQALWRARGGAADDALVFPAADGGPSHPSGVARAIKAAAKAAGLGDWPSPHTLRHSFATTLFRGGWNAKQVQLVLGHHSPAFTLATYVHLLPDDLPASPFDGQLEPLAGGNQVGTRPDETGRDDRPAVAANLA